MIIQTKKEDGYSADEHLSALKHQLKEWTHNVIPKVI